MPVPLDPVVTPAGAKVVVEVARPGLARLRMYFRGKKVVVVGPPGAGKSTFMDYMHYEVFDPEQHPERTVRPRSAKNFKFTLGRNRALFASIKRALDMPGQPDPKWVAEEAFHERPHALVIVLDATAPLNDAADTGSTEVWLRRFCRAAEQTARGMRSSRNRLRTVVVALNKADKVTAEELKDKEDRCKEILEEHWRASAPDAPNPRLLKCISVSVPGRDDETRWIDAVLSDLAIGLREDR